MTDITTCIAHKVSVSCYVLQFYDLSTFAVINLCTCKHEAAETKIMFLLVEKYVYDVILSTYIVTKKNMHIFFSALKQVQKVSTQKAAGICSIFLFNFSFSFLTI